jgi:restriction endonuclease S subunit
LEGLEISIVSYSEIIKEKKYYSRFESEFFTKKNNILFNRIISKNFKFLDEILFLTDGEHGNAKTSAIGFAKYYGARNVLSGILDDNNVEFITEDHQKRLQKSKLEKNDILISCVGANIGFASIVPNDVGEANIVRNVALMRSKSDNINNHYLLAYFLSKYGKTLFVRMATGNAQPLVSLEYIKTIPIFIPSLQFQKKIELLIEEAKGSLKQSQQTYAQAEAILLHEIGLMTITFEKPVEKLYTPEELIEELENFGVDKVTEFEYIMKYLDDLLENKPWVFEQWSETEQGRKIVKAYIEAKQKVLEVNEKKIALAEKKLSIHEKNQENLQNIFKLNAAEKQKTNIKSFKESFGTTGRLDAEYYQSKYEIIEEIIKNKGYYTISEVFNLLSNASPSNYTETGTKVIKTKNIRIPTIDIYNLTDHTNEKRILIQKNDLIFASMGVGSLGRISFIENDIENCTTDGTLRIFRAKKEFQNKNIEIPTLLFLTSKVGQELIYKYVIGSTGIISISKENVENLIIPQVSENIASEATEMVLNSQKLKSKSEQLLSIAKRAVEMAIEEGEAVALAWIEGKI